jgi:hypothetical protein
MSEPTGMPASLKESRKGTHVDFIVVPQSHARDGGNGPWHYVEATADLAETRSWVVHVIEQLEAASRRIVSIQPIIGGYAAYLQTSPRSTSQLGVEKSEELGYGYSYTHCLMIVSEDI